MTGPRRTKAAESGDLTRRVAGAPPTLPKGLSFEIADLIRIRGWTDFRNFRMEVRLDHGTSGEEYEEVIAIHPAMNSPCQLIMWRSAGAVFVQPLIGRRRRYRSVVAALDSATVKPHAILTDITAPTWPIG
jgi:hypothetical protein